MAYMEEDGEGEKVPSEMLHRAIREATIALNLCPVMMGSAYKNKGVQPLLDSVQNQEVVEPLCFCMQNPS